MRPEDLQKTFADICVLFELALSIGQSLDLRDNCERFLRTLMARKNLGFAAVWLYADVLDGLPAPADPNARTLRLLHGVPLAHVRETVVSANHQAFAGASAHPICFAPDEPGRQIEDGPAAGTYALFPLGPLGFLRLFASGSSRLATPAERSQLETVVSKFTVSIEGCLAHQRAIAEVARRERLERERQAIQQQLEHAHKMEAIGRLAGGVAHDFNNLLTVVMGRAELLRQQTNAASSSLARDVDAILSAAERAAQLTGQLLTFSRRGKLRTTLIAIEPLVAEAIQLVERTINANITVSFQRDAGGAHVLGDPALLQSVVINLLVNACDAMPTGGRLTVATHAVDAHASSQLPPGQRFVRIVVRDTGTGMDPEVVSRIFEPFFTTKALGRGTGLGLSVAYGTIQSHGGTIDVTSAKGEGTQFTILLPLAKAMHSAAPASLAPSAHADPPRPRPQGDGEGILVVDDQDDVRDVMGTILRNLGYSPLLASDGATALAMLEQARDGIHAVLLDVRMPRMDGVETLRRLRQHRPDLPVIIVSGFGAEHDLDRMRAVGVDGEVEKPFTEGDLGRALAKVLRHHARGRG